MGIDGEYRGEIFQGVVFLHKNKIKCEIFNEKKSLLTKIISSVNLNLDGMGIKDKKFVYYGEFTGKSVF